MTTVHPWEAMRSSARVPQKRDISTRVAPAWKHTPIPQIWPKVCDSGSVPRSTSSSSKAKGVRAVVVMFMSTLWCVSMTPLGAPVVPEV